MRPLTLIAAITGAILLAICSPALAQQVPAPGPAPSPSPGSGVQAPPPPDPGATPESQPVEPPPPPKRVATTAPLRPGARGAAVGRLQRALRSRGIRVKITGRYDRRTRAGVRLLQRRLRMRPTGIANAKVLRRLGLKVRSVAGTVAFTYYPVPEPDDMTPSATGFIWPTNGMVSSPFGPRWGRMHEGLDIAAPEGQPIRAAKAGVVAMAGVESGYGNLVILDHGNGDTTRYGHMSAFDVTKGDVVAIGQVIGRVGSTGNSTGDHLHFEIRIAGVAVDPRPYL